MAADPARTLLLAPAPGGGWWHEGAPWSPPGPFYAVLGDPVTHSLSPVLQGAALRARALPHAYHAIRITAGGLAAVKAPDAAPGLTGFNVTAPLKGEAAALCDVVTPAAARAGAVNCVRAEGTRWSGHNTDLGGILNVLGREWPQPTPADVGVVLGTGGAARAAVLALLAWGARRVSARCRTPDSGRRFRTWLDGCGARGAAAVAVEPLAGAGGACPGEAAVWVVALAGGVPAAPYLPDGPRSAPSLALDLRYGAGVPREAPWSVPRVDGSAVLLAQGGLSFAWWFGEPVPWAAMREALGGAEARER